MDGDDAGAEVVSGWDVLTAVSAAVGAFAAMATFVVAIVAAVLALRQLKQGRELAEEQARPYVVASLVENEAVWWFSDFVVRNVGQTAAHDLTIEFSRPWLRPGDGEDDRFMDTRFLVGTTSVLPPGGELRTSFLVGSDAVGRAEKDPAAFAPITVTLRYRDRREVALEDSYVIDPLGLKGTVRTDVHGVHHIASTLRAWAKKAGVTSF